MTRLLPNTAATRPRARIEVVQDLRQLRGEALPCVVGRDFFINGRVLSDFCFRDLAPKIDDLVTIVAAVAFADRAVERLPLGPWPRDLELVVPVRDPDFWDQARVKRALIGALGLVSGDGWRFEFTKRRFASPVEQVPLPLVQGVPAFAMPYSDGLDSFAAARLGCMDRAGPAPVLVTVGRIGSAGRPRRERRTGARPSRLFVPFWLSGKSPACRLREPSYRTRGFVYNVAAGIAAHLSGAGVVVVPESGQAALGPSLVPVGHEALDLRTHPAFTRELAAFLALVLGGPVRFEHTRLWSTKGETLRELATRGGADGWERTRSCPRDTRQVHFGGSRVQCGVCGACLLRRQSLLAASLDEDRDRYLWPNLSAASLPGATAPGGRATTSNDRRHAVCGALSMADLARWGEKDGAAERVGEAAFQLAEALDEDVAEVRKKLIRLVAAHRKEWGALLERAGAGSFISGWAGGVRC